MPSSPTAGPWPARLPFFYGWIIVALGFVASVFGIGLTWAAGLLAVPMGAELEWSRSAFFFAVSLRGWLGIAVTPFVGPYLDHPNGPRRLVIAGGCLNTVSLLLLPFIDAEWQFIVLFGVVGGFAQAAEGGISAAIVPKWFVRRRGSAVAISTLGGSLAAVLLPPFLAAVTAAAGWRGSWAALGLLAFLIGTLPAVLLRRQPEDVGLLPDGSSGGSAAARWEPSRMEGGSFTLAEALHTSTFWVLLVAIALGSLVNNGIPASLAPIFVDRGVDFETAGHTVLWYGVGSIATKIIWGWIVNRFPIRGALLILTLYGSLALPSILLVPALGPLVYGALCGLYIGAYIFLVQMAWAEYFGRAHVGAISALGRPLGLMVGASGPFLLALTRDLTGSYDLGLWLNGLSAALCFGTLLLVRPVRRRAAADP